MEVDLHGRGVYFLGGAIRGILPLLILDTGTDLPPLYRMESDKRRKLLAT
jgi:hypothetical protein